jgi:hypothetical protein
MHTFIKDDAGYLDWIRNNPSGFVINSHRFPKSSYLNLHCSICPSIRTSKRSNWTTRSYIKICSNDREELTKWTTENFGRLPHLCGICNP